MDTLKVAEHIRTLAGCSANLEVIAHQATAALIRIADELEKSPVTPPDPKPEPEPV